MILAAINDTSYRIVLFLHILSAMVAFAPAFVHPLLGNQLKADDSPARPTIFGYMVTNGMRIYGTALIINGLLGFGLAGMSDDFFKLSQGWLMAAILIWIAMNGILHGAIRPTEAAIARGNSSDANEQKLAFSGMAITLLLFVQLYLMIWKPGL